MSVFDTANADALSVSPGDAARGPYASPLEAYHNSLDVQVRGINNMGLQEAFREEEADQIQRMQKAGVESIPSINPSAASFSEGPFEAGAGQAGYLDTARFFVHGGDQATADHLAEYDSRIADLQKRFPDLGLKHSRDLWDTVIQKAQQAERTSAEERTTWAGTVAGFAGSVAGQFDPRSNPLGPLALVAGGVGETALARIATEALGQGGVQTISELTGTAENRKLLGLDDGIAGSISRVAGAAIGGAALRGVGEGLHFAGKRWFKDMPGDPAPPPPAETGQLLLTDQRQPAGPSVPPEHEALVRDLLSGTRTMNDVLYDHGNTPEGRMGKARSILDTDYVASKLEPFDGPQPWEVPPPTATAIPKRVSSFVAPEIPVNIHEPGANIDAIARQVDPRAFAVYDKLTAENETYRRWLSGMSGEASNKLQSVVSDLSNKIDNLRNSIDTGRVHGRTINKAKKAELSQTLDDLMKQRDEAHIKMKEGYTPEMRQIADKQYANGIKLRDMSPVISRAYAYAKNQWELNAGDRELFAKMVRDGRRDFPQEAPPILNDTYENTLARFAPSLVEKAPILEQAPRVEAAMPANADAADYASAIVKENMKTLDEALDAYRGGLTKMLSGEEGTIKINGQDYNLHLDQDHVFVPGEDGEGSRRISIRQLLTENAETEEELKAVQSCSIV